MTDASDGNRDLRTLGPARLILTVFLPFAGGYFLSYLFRSINAVIAPRLTQDIGLGAADLGLLTAAYFLAFGFFQVPLGMLLDRFGPRRVQSCLLLLAALGGVVFSIGEDRDVLMLGRALIGFGFAGGLMASFKAVTLWFPEPRWPLVNGGILFMGGLGAMSATAPVEALLAYSDWRGLFVWLSGFTVLVALAIFFVVPERDRHTEATTLSQQLRAIRTIYSDRLFWRLAPVVILCNGSGLAIISLWAGPWLADVSGFAPVDVADRLFLTTAFMAAGFIVGGLAADLLRRLGVGLVAIIAGGTFVYILSQVVITFELAGSAAWPWILFGLVANLTMLAYPRLAGHFPLSHAGRVNTALNVLVFVTVFLIQSGMGEIIDFWPRIDGRYDPLAYRTAFTAILALQGLGFLWLLIAPRRRQCKAEGAAEA